MAQEPIFELYETVSTLCERMLDAARAGDWALIDRLEQECAAHVARIDAGMVNTPLSWQERTRKLRLVQRIFACDREIRHLLEPWMAELAVRMNSASGDHQLFARA